MFLTRVGLKKSFQADAFRGRSAEPPRRKLLRGLNTPPSRRSRRLPLFLLRRAYNYWRIKQLNCELINRIWSKPVETPTGAVQRHTRNPLGRIARVSSAQALGS